MPHLAASCPLLAAKLDRLSLDGHFIGGLIARQVPFIVAEMSADRNPLMLHIYAAVAKRGGA